MFKVIQEKAASYESEMIKFAQELVRMPSESLNESEVAQLIEKKMKELNYDKVFRDDFGNVIGVFLGREAEPTLLLTSHMDTVPIINKKIMFGSISDGKIFGRGASDCKSGIAVQVFSGRLLRETLLPQKGNLIVAATVAEENGCSVGVKRLIERTLPMLGINPTYAILGEPTDLGLYYGHDGWITLDVKVSGNNPSKVKEAAKIISRDLQEPININRVSDQVENLLVHEPKFQQESTLFDASMQIDRRLKPGEDEFEAIRQVYHNASQIAQSFGTNLLSVMVKEEVQKLPSERTTRVRKVTHAWSTDPFHPLMERARYSLSAADCKVRPGKWQLKRLCMGTAGSILTREYNIPTIGYGPGSEEMAHADDEYVEIKKIKEALVGTTVIAHSLIGNSVFDWH